MERNEKIAIALTAAITVGSTVLFATAAKKARNNVINQIQRNAPIKAVITLANTLSA